MPIGKVKGLRGLPGLNNLSENERRAFMLDNEDKLRQYSRNPGLRKRAAEVLYNNQQFIKTFGEDAFHNMDNGSEDAYNQRNTLLRDKVVRDAFIDTYSPFDSKGNRDNKKGLGRDWEKYNSLSTDAKLKLLQSNYLTPSEFEQQHKDDGSWMDTVADNFTRITNPIMGIAKAIPGVRDIANAIDPVGTTKDMIKEGWKQHLREENNGILDRIYNEDGDQQAYRLGTEVANLYSSPAIADLSDDEVKKKFVAAITPNSYIDSNGQPNMGVTEYAAHYGDGSEGEVSGAMEDFSIDDMRQLLAKKSVYDRYMSPDMAATVLNNEAKRYLTQHQGSLTKFGLFLNDVGISALSYSADKVNGIYNLGLWAEDSFGDLPVVLVDDRGTVIDPSKTALTRDVKGNMFYQGEDGKFHYVHRQQINRRTLHNMGRNEDGSEDTSILNPQYWTRAEQFGTLDEDAQKKYEQLGSSPYKVVYNPNEESDLWYESFKMMSFGLADAASQLIPYGIGTAGKILSTASKVGRVGRALGAATDFAGRALTAQTKAGQVLQGSAGALGIAYAYERGAFQETLAQNLANAEEALLNTSRKDIYDRYQNDDTYKKEVDNLVSLKAAELKKAYLAQLRQDGGNQVADEKAIDNMLRAKAQDEVLNDLVQRNVEDRKSSQEYADLQNAAITSAGQAAFNTFLPEAIKYGIVNTVGFRKWMYSNPTGIRNKAAAGLEGLREVTTSSGRKRLTTETSKFLTSADKWKQFGKTLGSQVWGGAWTNGTDDMMVDAAERINQDSFDRYLHGYEDGNALADVYGFTDGFYSYLKGLGNSLGQSTTWNAATVGGLGSVLSFTPNMVNIASLATKSGREAYRNNFQQRYQRNEDGTVKRDEQGNPVIENISLAENWRDRVNFFVQNGVLNTYYGKKQAERDLQNHADYVNNILDDYDDFKAIEDLVTSDIALNNTESIMDQKTMRFIKAIQAVNALERLGQDKKDPATLSSVIQGAKDFISKASEMQMEGDNAFTEDEVNNILAQYYAHNPGVVQSDAQNQIALYQISQNAQKLQEATEAYNKAEEQLVKIENNLGRRIDPAVRNKLKLNQALDSHWRERVSKMQEEIDDTSDIFAEVSQDNLLPSIGSRKNAESLIKVYDKQQVELQEEMDKQKRETQRQKEKLDNALSKRKEAKNSDEIYAAQKRLEEAQAEYGNALQQESYLRDLIGRASDKRAKITAALNAQVKDENGKYVDRILTADEIFTLDPVTRARMMSPENRSLYSVAQQREIAKLEQRLLMRDADALGKIQDIARLSQRIASNEDAYNRIAQNPDAAAVQIEAQRAQAADAASRLINQRNAETVAEFINQYDEAMKSHTDVSQEQKNDFTFRILRKLNPTLLDIMSEDSLLPQYQQQVLNAKEWGKVVADIDAVISESEESQEWKDNVLKNIEQVIEKANTREEVISNLEQVVDDVQNPQVAQDFEKVLNGLEKLGYQRDATIIENRRQRKQREEAEAQRKKKAEEDAKIAAAEAQAKAQEAANAQQAQAVNADSSNLIDSNFFPVTGNANKAEQQGEASEPMDLTGENSSLGWQVNPDVKITREIANKDFGERYTDAATDENVDSYEQPKLKATADYLNGKINDRDYLAAMGLATGEHSWLDSPQTSKEDIAKEAQKRAEDRKKYLKGNKKESSSVNNKVEEQLIIDNGDSVQGISATIDEQMSETDGEKMAFSSEQNTDIDAVNGTGEYVIETSTTALSGNAMSEWKPEPLKKEGRLEHKKGARQDDSMNRYYAWLDAAGIKLQNIIDQELGLIIRRNPHAKIKFMVIRPENNATHDGDMKSHLMLVLDYDNKINKDITNIHNNENGGVLESNGKKYLVIGTVGYGNRNADKLALYDILFSNNPKSPNGYGLIKRGQGEFFRAHPDERFYVREDISTEIVPASLIPGYIVKQLESDENPTFRSISELLSDSLRNPDGLRMEDMAFGIQELTKFLVVGADSEQIMIPRNTARNSGSAFVLIPACNGKMIPSYLKPLFYNEMRDGDLKEDVMQLLNALVSPDYATRLQAVVNLSTIFHFDKDGDFILVGKPNTSKQNLVSLVKDGKPLKSFVLDSSFDRQEFMEAFSEMNPRVNVTKSVLQSNVLLQRYDAAGALSTDIALLHAAGSSYSIYGLDAQGNMLQPETMDNDVPKTGRNSDFRNGDRSQVVFRQQFYNYDINEGKYYLNGIPIQDETLIRDLDYNRRIIENGISPLESKGVWSIYILGNKEHPEAIKVNKNTKEVRVISDAEAAQLMERKEKEDADKKRAEAAEEALKQIQKVEGVNLSDDEGMVIDDETGEMITPDELRQRQTERAVQVGEKEKKEGEGEVPAEQPSNQSDKLHRSEAELESSGNQANIQNFRTLAKSKQWRKQVKDVINQKWPDAPNNIVELEKFLQNKNVSVDVIGTSEADVQAWIKTLVECR